MLDTWNKCVHKLVSKGAFNGLIVVRRTMRILRDYNCANYTNLPHSLKLKYLDFGANFA